MKQHTLLLLISIFLLIPSLTGCTDTQNTKTNIDTDGDGYTDTIDAFPNNATEWQDTDQDGTGDNTDAFPHDNTEWKDSDHDGIGDNNDYKPYDNTTWEHPEIKTLSDHNITQTINEQQKPIQLIITGNNCDITIHKNTTITEIILSGNNTTIHLSINHTYTLTDSGNNNSITYYDQTDPLIQKMIPYLQKINTNDPTLQTYAQDLINDCGSTNTECHINTLYRHIITTYKHIETTTPLESLQTPQQTITTQQGSCEDLTILLTSLLENIGITTYLVHTENHIYPFVTNLNTQQLWSNIEASLRNQVETDWGENLRQTYQDAFPIQSLNVWYYGADETSTFGEYINSVTIDYTINSDQPLHFQIVHTYSDFINLTQGQPYNHYQEWEKTALIGILNTIEIDTYGGLVLINEGPHQANVTVNLIFTFQPHILDQYDTTDIIEYQMNSQTGILLDPTLDSYKFPGYSTHIQGELTAIDITTKQYYSLTK